MVLAFLKGTRDVKICERVGEIGSQPFVQRVQVIGSAQDDLLLLLLAALDRKPRVKKILNLLLVRLSPVIKLAIGLPWAQFPSEVKLCHTHANSVCQKNDLADLDPISVDHCGRTLWALRWH